MDTNTLAETILAILGMEHARLGLTREAIRESKLPAPQQNESGRLTLEDLSWSIRELETALLDLRTSRKIVLFKPTKGRSPNNGKVHIILREYAANVGADPEEVGDFQIARTL